MRETRSLLNDGSSLDGSLAGASAYQGPAGAVATVRVQLVDDQRQPQAAPIRSAADVFRLLGPSARSWDREHFVTVLLDGKGRVIGVDEVSVGTVTAALVHPREILKTLILANAVSFIVAHNHPSGDPTPSNEDVALTRRLKAAGELMGIRLLDHVVIGEGRFHSMQEAGQV